nr:retrovirus-related Pol polyprotein from transposon TNT 1-94 [Tanacetum cinerariifolium]
MYLKKLYTYYMSPGTKLGDHIDEFNKLILNLANIDIEIEEEDQAHMLFTLLPLSYENFVETLLYGMESLTMKDGHLKRDCLMKKSIGFVKKDKRNQDFDFFDDEGNAYFGEARVLVGNNEITELVTNDDVVVAQGQLEDKQLEEKKNTDCLVNEQENVHLDTKVRANITITGVPGQKDAEGNVAEKKKVKESIEAYLGKLLKYNACLTRWSPIRGFSTRKRC